MKDMSYVSDRQINDTGSPQIPLCGYKNITMNIKMTLTVVSTIICLLPHS